MGELAEPTQEERDDRHKLSAAIVESVAADEKMPLPLTTVSIAGKGRFYPADEVENLMFHFADEIQHLLAERSGS